MPKPKDDLKTKLEDPALSALATPAEDCTSCFFYQPTPAGRRGDCRRFPPTLDSGFPTVHPGMWCGEFKARPWSAPVKVEKVEQKP